MSSAPAVVLFALPIIYMFPPGGRVPFEGLNSMLQIREEARTAMLCGMLQNAHERTPGGCWLVIQRDLPGTL